MRTGARIDARGTIESVVDSPVWHTGLDVYEPAFFQRREDWLADKYSVKVALGVEINQCVGTPSSRRHGDLWSYATGTKTP